MIKIKDQETIIRSYDIVNNKICPWCRTAIDCGPNYSSELFWHLYCRHEDSHLKVMYEKETNQWQLIRIYFRNEKSIDNTLLIDKRYIDRGLVINESFDNRIIMPFFDVFSYSLDDLRDKIKLYVLFS